jgi:thioredoxin 1
VTGKTIAVTDGTFETDVLQAETMVLVDFWAPWCTPCHMIAPSLEKIAEEYAGQLVIAKVNTDEDMQYAAAYGVRGIPNLILFHGGEPVDRIVGAVPYPYLKGRVENALAIVHETSGPDTASTE